MKITVVSDEASWINRYIPSFKEKLMEWNHNVLWIYKVSEIPYGDIVFYLSCGQLVPPLILRRNKHNIVVHESALPKGKGWSPLTWQILEGINDIPITLFEAVEKVDSGKVYLRSVMHFRGTELVEELRKIQADTSIDMCLQFIRDYPDIIERGEEQRGEETFYPRRNIEHSRLNPDSTIREQFNLLRVVDNERYPAFVDIYDERYIIKIYKKKKQGATAESLNGR